jgi:hypothetical protein
MTIEELLNYPGDMSKLSDADLKLILAPHFPLMRPVNMADNPAAGALPQSALDLIASTKRPGLKFSKPQ